VDPSQLGSGRDLGGVLTVDVNGHCFGVDLVQAHDRSPHLPTAAEWRYKERYSFSRIPKFDYQPGARLTLKVMNGFPHRQSSWSDGARQSIEGVLAEVLQEIELRAERAERDRLEEERRRLEEKRLWEVAMERAREDFAHSSHIEPWQAGVSRYGRAAPARSADGDTVGGGMTWNAKTCHAVDRLGSVAVARPARVRSGLHCVSKGSPAFMV
jgi:hypothetical protein